MSTMSLCIFISKNICKPYYSLLDMNYVDATCNALFCCCVGWYIFKCFLRTELLFIA